MRHWFARYRISNALDRGALGPLLAGGHVSRCPVCQAYARDLQSLHARLSRGAPSAPAPIVAAARRRRWPLLAGPAFALAAAAALALSLSSGSAPTRVAPVVVAPVPPAPRVVRVRDVADRVSAVLANDDTPLDAELHDLIQDGRRGLDAVLATAGLRRAQTGRSN
jgi:hypothetical protein